MDEKPDQIMSHIEEQRDQLGRNLNELETRVKGATDWRLQFDRNPMLAMGVALGGGLLLGTMVGGGKRNRSYSGTRKYWTSTPSVGTPVSSYSSGPSSSAATSSSSSSSSLLSSSPAVREQRKKATDTLEHIKAALIGFATAKVKEFMTEALPGFDQHFDEAERRNRDQSGGSSLYGNESGESYRGASGSGGGSSYGSGQSYGSQGSQSNQATTRTEQSANSPYTNQGAGQNTGLNI